MSEQGMETGMCSCDDNGERLDPCTIREVTARKEYFCIECGEVIKVGEKYQKIKGRCCDSWGTYHTCLPCSRIVKDYCAPIGALREILWDALKFDYVTGEENTNEWKFTFDYGKKTDVLMEKP